MLRVPLNKAHLKRTVRPLYGWTQATPQSHFLDPAHNGATVPIFPGMVAVKTGSETVGLIDGQNDQPLGLHGLYEGGDGIFEVTEQGVNATAVWVLAPDAEFEVLAPAFDTAATWTVPTDGSVQLVYGVVSGANRGKLTTVAAGTTDAGWPATIGKKPVAKLVKVNSADKITVAGLQVGEYVKPV